MALLRLPFALNAEAEDEYISHPKEADANLRFLKLGEENAPWTGYYSTIGPVKRAVANFGGVWFEIRRRENIFEAFKTARPSLNLNHFPIEGIDRTTLASSGEETPTPSRDQSPDP